MNGVIQQSPVMASSKAIALFEEHCGIPAPGISALCPAASPREYFRISSDDAGCVAAYSANTAENEAFIYLTHHLESLGIRVPRVRAVSADKTCYLLDDLGDYSLLDYLNARKDGGWDDIEAMYQRVLVDLIDIQLNGGANMNFDKCLGRKIFDSKQVYWDLLYFKYYFAKLEEIPFDEQKLDDEFLALASIAGSSAHEPYLMYRDFQARNIMIRDETPWYIDYQGAMRGPLQYDLASLLYQSRAGLPEELRERLLSFYIKQISSRIDIDKAIFIKKYYAVALARIMQNLGAYGFRGIIQRKHTFVESIPQALDIALLISRKLQIENSHPELHNLLNAIDKNKFMELCRN